MAASATFPGAALHAFGRHEVALAGSVHFALVAMAAGVAALASVGLTIAGVRRNDPRTVLVSTAFSTMSAIFLIHGVATPGIIAGPNGVVALYGAGSLPVGGALLALSALPSLRRPRDVRPLLRLQVGLVGFVIVAGAAGLAFPSMLPQLPKTGTPPAIALMIVGCLFYGVLVHRALVTFALTHRPLDLLAAVGCVWLAIALIPQMTMSFTQLGFYGGHVIELVGILMVSVPVAVDLRRAGASRPLVGDLCPSEIVASEEAFLGARVRALMIRLEKKDRSTEQHTRRVAKLAVQVAVEMKLPPATLRQLAVGGLLHDIGKLAVPMRILSKPGKLTEEEFAEIKRHPGAGLDLLRELGGFSPIVHRLVHEHHERLDGTGYPRGIAGVEIGIEPRILAVCDVWDAVTSDRVYRHAWDREEALALLRQDSMRGKLDAKCLHALERVLERGEEAAAETPLTGGHVDSEEKAA
jgi:putative nucleotidyltransferase with HDIG domain